MTEDALTTLERTGNGIDARTLKRAQFEAFEYTLEAPGIVLVRNGSYGVDADAHTYRVNVEDGVPVACECPSFQYREAPCKHMVSVAIRGPVLAAGGASLCKPAPNSGEATPLRTVATLADKLSSNGDECEACAKLSDNFPCADCYISGRKDVP